MRILTYLPRLAAIGGVEVNLVQVAGELAARGHLIDLFYEQDGNLSEDFRSFCEQMSAGASALYSDAVLRDLARIVPRALDASRCRPDLIYANNVSELAWAVAVRMLTRAPIVCELHELRPVRRISMAMLGGRVSRFVVPSRYLGDAWAEHGLDPGRVDVVPLGVRSGAYPQDTPDERLRRRVELGRPAHAYVVLYAGRVIAEKGVDVLLDAWAALGLAPDQGRLVITGVPAAPDRYVSELRERAPAGCHWIEMQRDIIPVLHAADVLVLPSVWDEPFGRIIIEAMATGLPVLASAVGGIPEILDGEFARMLFPRGDGAKLAERLSALQNWRRDDPGLGMRCVAHVADRFTLEHSVTRLERTFATAAPFAAT
jgi:glycosyltransferase involved in cell wall biosynthesis